MRVLGIDWGEKRVGFAISDPTGGISLPLKTVTVAGEKQAVEAIKDCCSEQGVDKIIVGMPINMDGTRGFMAEKVEKFIAKVAEEMDIPVQEYDERLTSSMADRVMLEAEMNQEKRKENRDKLAAQAILQGYLDSVDFL